MIDIRLGTSPIPGLFTKGKMIMAKKQKVQKLTLDVRRLLNKLDRAVERRKKSRQCSAGTACGEEQEQQAKKGKTK